MSETQESRCPKCGAKEAGHKTGIFLCGTYAGSTTQMTTCALRMWKQRAKETERRLEELQVMFRLHRRKLWLATPNTERCSAFFTLVAFDAETERMIKGSEGK